MSLNFAPFLILFGPLILGKVFNLLNFILFLCELDILFAIEFHQRMKLYKVTYTLRTFIKQRANKYSTIRRMDITRITFSSHHKKYILNNTSLFSSIDIRCGNCRKINIYS